MASRHVIGHKTRVALTSKTDAPWCSAQHCKYCCPFAEDADCQIVVTCAESTQKGSSLAPVFKLYQRFGATPDIWIVGDYLGEIGIMQGDFGTGRNGQQVDLCIGVGTFQS